VQPREEEGVVGKRWRWFAGIASALCFAGGLWILIYGGFDRDDPIGTGIGLYFLGKAFFVGPTLLLLSRKVARD
jgi:hypothetical protein